MTIPPFPLHWPEGVPRTAAERRAKSQFRTTQAQATKNVAESLRLFGTDSGKAVSQIVATSNIGGIDLAGGPSHRDPGVAVWFEWDGLMRCIAVDRYATPAENLQAIHHILEARRTEARHGGLTIARTAFKGFLALPNPDRKDWPDVLGVPRTATTAQIEAAYRERAKTAHPDAGGSADAMAALSRARDEALHERGVR